VASVRPGDLALSAFAVVVVLVGCDAWQAGYEVRNRTGQPIDVYWFSPGDQYQVANDMEPGKYVPVHNLPSGQCHGAGVYLEARDVEGNQIARFDGPICDGTVWEVVDS
jgi:hypothetical protein